MRCPFPGMDPYLEHPALWADVHNSLITAIRDVLSPILRPRYYVGLERRAYLLTPDDIVLVSRPDITVVQAHGPQPLSNLPLAEAGVMEVEMPTAEEISETYLEVHEVGTGKLITLIEVLSPVNKLNEAGREQYERKRANVLLTRTNLVEIDLLRSGEPMPVDKKVQSDYRILVSRGSRRPKAQLYFYNLRQPIPSFHVPLLPGDAEPLLEVGKVLHELYDRAAFDLRLDYTRPAVPPLSEPDAAWAVDLIQKAAS